MTTNNGNKIMLCYIKNIKITLSRSYDKCEWIRLHIKNYEHLVRSSVER